MSEHLRCSEVYHRMPIVRQASGLGTVFSKSSKASLGLADAILRCSAYRTYLPSSVLETLACSPPTAPAHRHFSGDSLHFFATKRFMVSIFLLLKSKLSVATDVDVEVHWEEDELGIVYRVVFTSSLATLSNPWARKLGTGSFAAFCVAPILGKEGLLSFSDRVEACWVLAGVRLLAPLADHLGLNLPRGGRARGISAV